MREHRSLDEGDDPPTVASRAVSELTSLLHGIERGDRAAAERFAGAIYHRLRALARRELARERDGHTLQPTALVHEVYLRLFKGDRPAYADRGHFWSAAASAIRRILVEHARRRGRLRRGGGRERIELTADLFAAPGREAKLVALDEAVARLAVLDPEKARLVELRFFAGMTLEECARALGVSRSTAVRAWRLARAWLQASLEDSEHDRP